MATNKQRVFVEEYLSCWNATEAARRAGYAYPNVEGPKNLVNPSIAEIVKRRLAEKAMPADEVLARLSDHARGSMADFIQVDDDGTPSGFNLGKSAPQHLIKKVSITKAGITFELYDAQSALQILAKHHGLLVERVELNDVTDYDDVSPDEQIKLYQGEINRLTAFAAWDRAVTGSADAEPGVAD